MKAALAVTKITEDAESNLRGILEAIAEASRSGADLVLFAETAPTGLVANGNPAHDLPLGQPVPGPITGRVAAAARVHSIYVGMGLFEREGDCLWDSATLINSDGQIALKYRRISQGWRDREWDPRVYREGTEIGRADTRLGSFAFLICGDLFDDALCARIRDMKIDYLLNPMSRDDNSCDQARWDRETRSEYLARVAMTRTTALIVNGLGGNFDPAFGGAMVVSPEGKVVAELPLGKPGILVVDMEASTRR